MPTSSRSRITPISPSVTQDLVALADQVEHRRADEDAGDDLADDGRDADALGDLRGHLGGDEDDQDVGGGSRRCPCGDGQ